MTTAVLFLLAWFIVAAGFALLFGAWLREVCDE